MIRKAIDNCGRAIVLSTSPGETPIAEAGHISNNANMWRIVDDVWDTWGHVNHLFDIAPKWYPYIRSGTWPDCDMIPLGRIAIRGERGKDRMTRLTEDEQYSLMTLFCISKSPLIFGGDLPSSDAFTLSLLINKQVLKMHSEATHVQLLYHEGGKVAITARNLKTGDIYLAMFNLNNAPLPVQLSVPLAGLGITGPCKVSDMWKGTTIDHVVEQFSHTFKAHSCGLYRLTPVKY